jgi:hypothetical protein
VKDEKTKYNQILSYSKCSLKAIIERDGDDLQGKHIYWYVCDRDSYMINRHPHLKRMLNKFILARIISYDHERKLFTILPNI